MPSIRVEMNYLKVYCNLIRKAENRTPPEGYAEKHHTFPKSIFGKNNRIVILTAREHYIAHALLEKIYIKRYGLKDRRTIKMIYAHSGITGNGGYINSYLYESNRKRLSLSLLGKNNPFYGKKHDEKTRKKMSENGKGKKMPPRTDEYKKMLSERMKNRVVTEETKIKISESKKGKIPWNKGKSGYITSWNKGKSLPTKNREFDYKLISPSNKIYVTNNLSYFCKNYTDYKLDATTLVNVARGKFKQHKNWRMEYVKKHLDNDKNLVYTIGN